MSHKVGMVCHIIFDKCSMGKYGQVWQGWTSVRIGGVHDKCKKCHNM